MRVATITPTRGGHRWVAEMIYRDDWRGESGIYIACDSITEAQERLNNYSCDVGLRLSAWQSSPLGIYATAEAVA
jgi:hypothetical protein